MMSTPCTTTASRSRSCFVFAHAQLALLCVLLLGRATFVSAQERLVGLQIVFRHGARAPFEIVPRHTDDWPVAPGQLTQTGALQHEAFGRYLRSNYLANTTFLHPNIYSIYDSNLVYVRSSNIDRTVGSALSILKTLYPGEPIPIPVHSVAEHDDHLLRFWESCPSYSGPEPELLDLLSDKADADFSEDDFEHIYEETGIGRDEVEHSAELIRRVFDNIWANRAQGIEIEAFLDELSSIIDEFEKRDRHALFVSRRGGDRGPGSVVLQAEIRDNLIGLRDNPDNVPHLIFYSAHDITLVGLYDVLGQIRDDADENLLPDFAESIIIEHWHDNTLLLAEGDSPNYIRVRRGLPNFDDDADEWEYSTEYIDFLCGDEMADQCDLNTWVEQDIFTYEQSCCSHNEYFRESGCADYFQDSSSNHFVCQEYREHCPTSGDLGSCGTEAVYSENDDRCVAFLRVEETQTLVETRTYRTLLGFVIALAIILVVILVYWLYQKRAKRYNNLDEEAAPPRGNNASHASSPSAATDLEMNPTR